MSTLGLLAHTDKPLSTHTVLLQLFEEANKYCSASFEVVHICHAGHLPSARSMLSTSAPAACSPTSCAGEELPRKFCGISHEGHRLLDRLVVLSLAPIEAMIARSGNNAWLARDLLDHLLLLRRGIGWVLVDEVSAMPHLLSA